jgi:hypothetical protein
VLHGLPAGGLTAADFEAACRANTVSCGTYTLAGDKLSVQYQNGQKEEHTYKPLQGGMQLDYIVYTPVQKFGAGAKLNGTWGRAFSAQVITSSSSGVNIVAPKWITFHADGTFSQRSVTGVETASAVRGANTSGSEEAQSAGTYALKNNLLTITRAGKTETHVIFPVAGDNLNIDGQVYNKEK